MYGIDLDLEGVKVKCKYANQKLFDGNNNCYPIYITVSKKFTVHIYMTLTLIFRIKVKCKYASQKPIPDLLFDSNSNFYPGKSGKNLLNIVEWNR